jgi:Flp pilus assembly protein TadG
MGTIWPRGEIHTPVRLRRSRRGQSLAEFALSAPLIFLIALGIADLGRAFYYQEAVANAARQALRIAVLDVQEATGDSACSSSHGSTATATTTLPPPSATLATIGNEASLESTSNGTPSGTSISGATLSVTWHCDHSDKAITNATATSLDPSDTGSAAIEVKVTYPMNLITPFLGTFIASPVNIVTDDFGRAQY